MRAVHTLKLITNQPDVAFLDTFNGEYIELQIKILYIDC